MDPARLKSFIEAVFCRTRKHVLVKFCKACVVGLKFRQCLPGHGIFLAVRVLGQALDVSEHMADRARVFDCHFVPVGGAEAQVGIAGGPDVAGRTWHRFDMVIM